MIIGAFLMALGSGWQHVWRGREHLHVQHRDGLWFVVDVGPFVLLAPRAIVAVADGVNASRGAGVRGQVEIEVDRHNTTGAFRVRVSPVAIP